MGICGCVVCIAFCLGCMGAWAVGWVDVYSAYVELTYIHTCQYIYMPTPTSQFGYYGGYPGMRGAEHVQCSQQ